MYSVHGFVSFGKYKRMIRRRFFPRKFYLHLGRKLLKCYIRYKAFYGADIGTLRKVDRKYLESFEKLCRRRMEKIIWPDRVRNKVLHDVKTVRNILHTIKRRKAIWIGHILHRNCCIKHVAEGKIEGSTKMAGRG